MWIFGTHETPRAAPFVSSCNPVVVPTPVQNRPPQLQASNYAVAGGFVPPFIGAPAGMHRPVVAVPGAAASAMAKAAGIVVGARVEAEWTLGRWHAGQVVEMSPDGTKVSIRYDDGYLQWGVQSSTVRVVKNSTSGKPLSEGGGVGASSPGDWSTPASAQVPASQNNESFHTDPGDTDLTQPVTTEEASTGFTTERESHSARSSSATYSTDVASRLLGGLFCTRGQAEKVSILSGDGTGPASKDQSRASIASIEDKLRQRLIDLVDRFESLLPRDGGMPRTSELKEAIEGLERGVTDAQCMSVHGPEIRHARDALLAVESFEFRQRADKVVNDAIESDDWWKMQAAMQAVVGTGSSSELSSRLSEAMKTHKRRQEVTQNLKRGVEAKDPARLRTAIEHALKSHLKESVIKKARDELRSLEARLAASEQLKQAMAGGDPTAIRNAINAAEKSGFKDAAEKDALEAAKNECQIDALSRLDQFVRARDHETLGRELLRAQKEDYLGVDHVADYNRKVKKLKEQDACRKQLQRAVEARDKSQLDLAIRAGEAADLQDADIQLARDTVEEITVREKQAVTRAQAALDLQAALQSDDATRLSTALASAEHAGLGGQEAAPARERLRYLRARAGALQELRDSVQASDLYRLRAALATARGAGVAEPEIKRARDALKNLEAQAQVRRSLEAAAASQDSGTLHRLLEQARQVGLPKREIACAEAQLKSMGESKVVAELRAAREGSDVGRLRSAVQVASTAGVSGQDLDAAWERIRQLEKRQWLSKQLRAAVANDDTACLQAAIRQAELEGYGHDVEVSAARAELQHRSARVHARQELQLARAGGNPYALMTAIRAAENAGVPENEIDMAKSEMASLSSGGASPSGPPTDPKNLEVYAVPATDPKLLHYHAPPTDPKMQDYVTPLTDPKMQDQVPTTDPQLQTAPTTTRRSSSREGTRQRVRWAQ
eukprot:TRINITY_DN33821_c0_g1_i1.p1 TRINITY_DN33821_c0_g1~~TRINITY_DN33821_c0_g1_i1.p1  ORF type:complete len:955 (-),score=171.65 TRINITY_DN33821_c0_g1_i1:37-2901(-)